MIYREKNIIFTHDDIEKRCKNKRVSFYVNNTRIYDSSIVVFTCEDCKKEFDVRFYIIRNSDNLICKQCKIKRTSIEKYGTSHHLKNKKVIQKREKTNLIRYGVKHVLSDSEKIKNSVIEKYGVENISKIQEIKIKKQNTFLKNYGVSNNFSRQEIAKKAIKNAQSDSSKNKRSKTNNEKYGVNSILELEDVRKKSQKFYHNKILNKINSFTGVKLINNFDKIGYYNLFQWKCIECDNCFEDHLYAGHQPRCPICYPKNQPTSKLEKEIVEYIKSLSIYNIKENDRTVLSGKELDIYLPDYNLAIEFNGLYWHSELQGKDKKYHLNKTTECEKKGIHLLHIFEDEWIDKKEIIKSIIKTKLGVVKKIYGRTCIIREIENQKNFLNANHLQGYMPAKINIGLYHEDELVSLLTFSKPRFNKNYDWEILRYANKLGHSVVGGFAKLLKYFKNKYSGSIITYSDKRYFDGSIYNNNSFKKIKPSNPSYYYIKSPYLERYNRQQFQKHKLKEKLEVFDPNLTEWENMQLNGWDRIWDCGNNCFIQETNYET